MKVVVAAVAENRPPFSLEIVHLFRSLAALGGGMAAAARIAYFIDAIDPQPAAALAALGVIVKLVPPLIPGCPHANKIHMLLDDQPGEVLVALDADIVVARDFSRWLGRAPFAAKPVDHNPLTEDQWARLLAPLDVAMPTTRYLTHFQAIPVLPYYNSGVLILERTVTRPLGSAWRQAVTDVRAALASDAALAQHSFFTDQFALTAALGRLQVPQLALPLEMNFPTHHRIHDLFDPHRVEPYLLHHHHCFDVDGHISRTGYAGADTAIGRINAVIGVQPDVREISHSPSGGA